MCQTIVPAACSPPKSCAFSAICSSVPSTTSRHAVALETSSTARDVRHVRRAAPGERNLRHGRITPSENRIPPTSTLTATSTDHRAVVSSIDGVSELPPPTEIAAAVPPGSSPFGPSTVNGNDPGHVCPSTFDRFRQITV